jgi:ankyrin repeat protein
MIASQYNQKESVKALIELGADINAKNDFSSSAIFIAQAYGWTEVEKILSDAGAESEYKGD